MLKNYLLIALRFFSRQRGFSIINIFGLTIGIACSLLILLYVQDELKFDRFHEDSNFIYRLGFEGKLQGKLTRSTLTGFPVAETLRSGVPQIESTLRVAHWQTFPVRYENQSFTEKYLLLADRNFFDFFTFRLIEGNPDSVLTGNRKVVISESAAKRYFNYKGKGDRPPIGKTLQLAQGYTVKVSGIAEDAPVNSHFHYSLILSLTSWEQTEPDEWLNGKVITYYKIGRNASPEEADIKIQQVLKTRLNDELTHLRNTNLEEYKKQGSELKYFSQPLTDIHLHSRMADEFELNGSIQYIYLFSSIAAFITFLACINFMNLTTARSASRAKEVAVRKAVGAQNNRLIFQFLLESYFYVIAAVIFAIAILVVALTPFNYFTEKELAIRNLFSIPFIIGIVTFILITGVVAGSYPAFYLTHFSPIDVLKGDLRGRLRSYGIRNVLVIFQFFISSALIVATLVVYQQLQYVQDANLGFNKYNVINLLHTKNLGRNAEAFKNEILKLPNIISASYCNRLPPNIDWQAIFRTEGTTKDFSLGVYEVDHDHLRTMGYKMVGGRFFSPEHNDSMSVILNQTAADKLGINDFRKQKLFTTYDLTSGKSRNIIGIIQDFNFQSLKDPIQPMAMVLGYQPNWEMAIRLKGGEHDQAVESISRIFKKYAGDAPFEFSLLEDNFVSKHATEKRIGLLFIFFTTLAIVIACLGLFGLATFTAEQQRKSIGVRKVLGASVSSIVQLLNKDFLKLVLIANIIAWPVSWMLMQRWLAQFAYHVSIPWWTFVIATIITFSIAFISITGKAIGAARGNPVNSLRNE
jgi:putative ABC transport system permease protein